MSAVPSRKLILVVVVTDDEVIYDFCAFRRRDAHNLNDDIRIFVDATFKIIGRDYEEFADLIEKVKKLSEITDTDFVFTVSEDEDKLPARVFNAAEKI